MISKFMAKKKSLKEIKIDITINNHLTFVFRPGEVFSEPIKFYWHVQWHAEEYRYAYLVIKTSVFGRPEKMGVARTL